MEAINIARSGRNPFALAPLWAVRSAISRAYYSAFWSARTWFNRRARNPDDEYVGHEALWRSLGPAGPHRDPVVFNLGMRLLGRRHDADYRSAPAARWADVTSDCLEDAAVLRTRIARKP